MNEFKNRKGSDETSAKEETYQHPEEEVDTKLDDRGAYEKFTEKTSRALEGAY